LRGLPLSRQRYAGIVRAYDPFEVNMSERNRELKSERKKRQPTSNPSFVTSQHEWLAVANSRARITLPRQCPSKQEKRTELVRRSA
jgi:hypothetical protein